MVSETIDLHLRLPYLHSRRASVPTELTGSNLVTEAHECEQLAQGKKNGRESNPQLLTGESNAVTRIV